MPFVERAELDLLDPAAADAVVSAVDAAVSSGAAFSVPPTPERLFRHAVASAIDAIEARGDLLRRFLLLGPFEREGPIPPELTGKRLTDEECNKAITLIYSHAVNRFQGQLAELLALGSFVRLVADLQRQCRIPASVLFVGDAAMPLRSARAKSKGADVHLLNCSKSQPELVAVGEVKSYAVSPGRLARQLNGHATRAAHGLQITDLKGVSRDLRPAQRPEGTLFLSAVPSTWRLPRWFEFVETDGRTLLQAGGLPEIPEDSVSEVSPNHWHVTLGWSQEALASQAYSLTYWYMEELGVDLFSDGSVSPSPEMSHEEAGANAAKEALYHAIRRCTNPRAEQRAIALYNAYGFGSLEGQKLSRSRAPCSARLLGTERRSLDPSRSGRTVQWNQARRHWVVISVASLPALTIRAPGWRELATKRAKCVGKQQGSAHDLPVGERVKGGRQVGIQ